jgi:hypothetical protein
VELFGAVPTHIGHAGRIVNLQAATEQPLKHFGPDMRMMFEELYGGSLDNFLHLHTTLAQQNLTNQFNQDDFCAFCNSYCGIGFLATGDLKLDLDVEIAAAAASLLDDM